MFRALVLISIMLLAGCKGGAELAVPPVDGPVCTAWPGALMVGTARSDELLDVLVDAQGRVVVAGYEDGVTGTTNIEPAGNARGIVLSYGPDGAPLSRQVIDTAGTDVVEALALDPHSDTLYLAGRTDGALPGFVNQGQFDLFLGPLATADPIAGLAQFGDARPQHPHRIEAGMAGVLVVAGFDDVYVPSNYVDTWENPVIDAFSTSGAAITRLWQWNPQTSEPDALAGLAVAAGDGGIYVTGRKGSGSGAGMFVAHFDAQGSEVWYRQQTAIAYDMGAALALLPDGHLLLAGSSFATLGEASHGQQDVIVRKLDARTGEPIWTVQYGSSESDWVTDMAVDAQGRVYVVGETLGALAPGAVYQGSLDAFLLKLDPDGQLLAARQWGSAALDSPTAVAVDGCEQAFVVGYTEGALAGPSHGGRDGFILPFTN